jgi:hypothetical protein
MGKHGKTLATESINDMDHPVFFFWGLSGN